MVAVVCCEKCKFQLTGFRCLGTRNPNFQVKFEEDGYGYYNATPIGQVPAPCSGCSSLLEPTGEVFDDKWVVLECTAKPSHGKMAIKCCGMSTKLIFLEDNDLELLIEKVTNIIENRSHHCDNSPSVTCVQCGFTMDSVLCCRSHEPMFLEQDGYYERIASIYVFRCGIRCGDAQGGSFFYPYCKSNNFLCLF